MTRQSWIAAACLGAVATLPVAANAAPSPDGIITALSASSSASALTVNLLVNGVPLTLAPALLASGSAPPVYSVKTGKAAYAKSESTSNGKFTLSTTATKIIDHADSPLPTPTKITSTASSGAATFASTLSSSSFGPLMTVTATKILTKAVFKLTNKGLGATAGSTTMDQIVVNAPLLGINNATYTYDPLNPNPLGPNYVLFQNSAKSITIYLNAQTITWQGTGRAARKTSIKVDAVDVHIDNFSAFGTTVSGDIEVGSTFAD